MTSISEGRILYKVGQSMLFGVLDSWNTYLSDIKPSMWAEKYRSMDTGDTPWAGKFTYDNSPYTREIVDCLHPSNPAKWIAVMKGGQIGFTTGVIENGIGWIISEEPGPVLLMTGHEDLSEEGMQRIDRMIDSCGIRPLIRPSTIKSKNKRSGDTVKSKEFPGGSLRAGSASNHALLRQRSIMYAFIDDFDSVKKSKKKSGNTRPMIEQRLAAYDAKMKLFYIGTPELKQGSNIEPVFLLGDQRYYHVPCPCCGEPIILLWDVESEIDGKKAGITYDVDSEGHVIESTVGYTCQKCGDFFEESHKTMIIASGEWRATAKASQPGFVSYHISSLYADVKMRGWTSYVRQYLEANPVDGSRDEHLHQTFVNLVLGQTYELTTKEVKAESIQNNIQPYPIGIVPEELSVSQGNGRIVMLTCACDLNGIEDDARVDYEIIAWSETGTSYSVKHGSIGTFVYREGVMKNKMDRARWTYKHNQIRSVWPEVEKVIYAQYSTDNGRKMMVNITGVDCGHYTQLAYAFIDKQKKTSVVDRVIGLKGDKETQFRKDGVNYPIYKAAQAHAKLWLLDVNYIKDWVADYMALKWDANAGDNQPPNFMNFPQPGVDVATNKVLYGSKDFFKHFEAEERAIETKDDGSVASRWRKKADNLQNHHWDIFVYNVAIKNWFADQALKNSPLKKGTWSDFVALVKQEWKRVGFLKT